MIVIGSTFVEPARRRADGADESKRSMAQKV